MLATGTAVAPVRLQVGAGAAAARLATGARLAAGTAVGGVGLNVAAVIRLRRGVDAGAGLRVYALHVGAVGRRADTNAPVAVHLLRRGAGRVAGALARLAGRQSRAGLAAAAAVGCVRLRANASVAATRPPGPAGALAADALLGAAGLIGLAGAAEWGAGADPVAAADEWIAGHLAGPTVGLVGAEIDAAVAAAGVERPAGADPSDAVVRTAVAV